MVERVAPNPPPSLPPSLAQDPVYVEQQRLKVREFYLRDALFNALNTWWARLFRRLRGGPAWITDGMLDDYVICSTNHRYGWGRTDPPEMIGGVS